MSNPVTLTEEDISIMRNTKAYKSAKAKRQQRPEAIPQKGSARVAYFEAKEAEEEADQAEASVKPVRERIREFFA